MHAGIASFANDLEARGIVLETRHTSEETFNEIGFHDPDGQSVGAGSAHVFARDARRRRDFALRLLHRVQHAVDGFRAGARVLGTDGIRRHGRAGRALRAMPLTSDHLDIAFHRPRTLDRPMLVFRDPNMRERLARIRAFG